MDSIVIMRKLGKSLPADTARYLEQFEGSARLVASDRPRDVAYTEDIIAHTTGFALALDGDILLDNIKTLQAAEDAKARARVVTSIKLAPEEVEAQAEGPVFTAV